MNLMKLSDIANLNCHSWYAFFPLSIFWNWLKYRNPQNCLEKPFRFNSENEHIIFLEKNHTLYIICFVLFELNILERIYFSSPKLGARPVLKSKVKTCRAEDLRGDG